jgi:hypothetical protein
MCTQTAPNDRRKNSDFSLVSKANLQNIVNQPKPIFTNCPYQCERERDSGSISYILVNWENNWCVTF